MVNPFILGDEDQDKEVVPLTLPVESSAPEQEAPKEIALPSMADAIQAEKEDAAHRGDLHDFGLATIGAMHYPTPQEPRYTGPSQTAVMPGQVIPPRELGKDESLFAKHEGDDKAEARDEARTNWLQQNAQVDAKLQADRATGDTAGVVQDYRDKDELAKQAEWGKDASSHPGWLGKAGHIAAKIGNVAGMIVAPSTMALVPGTPESNWLRERGQERQDLGAADDAAKQAIDKENADANWLKEHNVSKNQWEVVPNSIGPNGRSVLLNKNTHETMEAPEGFTPYKDSGDTSKAPATPAQVAEYGKRISTLGLTGDAAKVYGNAPAGTSVAELDKRYSEAAALKGMGDKEAETAVTNQMRKDAANEHQEEFTEKQNAKLVNYRDVNGDLVSGTRKEALDTGVKPKDIHGETSQALVEKSRQAYTQYGRIMDNAQAAEDTMGAWSNETDRQAALDVSKQYWDHINGSVVAASIGVNPEYTQQLINSDAYKKMSPQGQEHMQNMFQLWSDALNLVKQETGGVPRGQAFLQKEDAILPHPDKTSAMNEKALQNLVKRLHTDAGENPRPSDMPALRMGLIPRGAVDVTVNGKDLGYATPEQQQKGTYTPWPK